MTKSLYALISTSLVPIPENISENDIKCYVSAQMNHEVDDSILGKVLIDMISRTLGVPAGYEQLKEIGDKLLQLEALLDEADQDDYFGTEGWRYRLGWSN